jgi:DNA uptake protein ComE-like DNA-binding protein
MVIKLAFMNRAGTASSHDPEGVRPVLIRTVCISGALCSVICAVAIAQMAPSMMSPAQRVSSKQEAIAEVDKINLNVATAGELRKLPRLNARGVSAIIEARTKSKFVDWNDFATRRVVPFYVREEIKNRVAF